MYTNTFVLAFRTKSTNTLFLKYVNTIYFAIVWRKSHGEASRRFLIFLNFRIFPWIWSNNLEPKEDEVALVFPSTLVDGLDFFFRLNYSRVTKKNRSPWNAKRNIDFWNHFFETEKIKKNKFFFSSFLSSNLKPFDLWKPISWKREREYEFNVRTLECRRDFVVKQTLARA